MSTVQTITYKAGQALRNGDTIVLDSPASSDRGGLFMYWTGAGGAPGTSSTPSCAMRPGNQVSRPLVNFPNPYLFTIHANTKAVNAPLSYGDTFFIQATLTTGLYLCANGGGTNSETCQSGANGNAVYFDTIGKNMSIALWTFALCIPWGGPRTNDKNIYYGDLVQLKTLSGINVVASEAGVCARGSALCSDTSADAQRFWVLTPNGTNNTTINLISNMCLANQVLQGAFCIDKTLPGQTSPSFFASPWFKAIIIGALLSATTFTIYKFVQSRSRAKG